MQPTLERAGSVSLRELIPQGQFFGTEMTGHDRVGHDEKKETGPGYDNRCAEPDQLDAMSLETCREPLDLDPCCRWRLY